VWPSRTPPGLPTFRGLLHAWAFWLAIPAGVVLGVVSDGARARVAEAVFAGTVVMMLGTSALYHRIAWRPEVGFWIRRLDHAAIFALIAGSYTAFGLLVLEGTSRLVVLTIVWTGIGIAIVSKFAWRRPPRWLSPAIGISVGWVGVFVFPELLDRAGLTLSLLVLASGVLYTVGALVYARRRPDPTPFVFGFHELFHALVLGAVGLQYAAVGALVMR
jgi:hemolysin III